MPTTGPQSPQSPQSPPSPAAGGAFAVPLSFAQERLWFLSEMDPGSAFYNVPGVIRLRGELDADALERALAEVVRRHESLRVVVRRAGGRPVQVVRPAADFHLPRTDLSRLAPDAAEAEAAARIDAESRAPFDLAEGPLFRASLFRLGAREHRLLLNLHHIVADGWSLGVLYREMGTVYAAFSEGRPSPLPAPELQFPDFAVWQRRWMQGEVLERQLAFWREWLADVPTVLELPADRPRPPLESHRGAFHRFELPPRLADALRGLGRAEGASLFMVLLAAFQALVWRTTGQERFVVGSPVANRTRRKTEGVIGCFINLLALRADLAGDPTFRALLARVREGTFRAFEHQDLPFERLVETLDVERDLSRAPLVQVYFHLQNLPPAELALPGLRATMEAVEFGTAKLDFSLDAWEREDGGLDCAVQYATDLFDAETVHRLADRWVLLLEAAVADPDAPVAALPLMRGAERDLLLGAWNDTAAPFPAGLVHERFEAAADARPDAPALLWQGESVSYGALESRANRLANHLRALGAGPETRVALCLERGPEMLVAVLAALKSGAAYVPLDPAYPAERIALVLEDCGAEILLTEAGLQARLPATGARAVRVDADRDAIAAAPDARPVPAALPENAAYAIYTSGSTGRPKGVAVPHRAVANFLETMRRRPGLSAGDVLLAVTTLSFDIAVLELLLPLSVGGTVALASRDDAGDGARLAELLARTGATVMQATPATWQGMLAAGWTGTPGLRMLAGGEALPAELAERLLARGAELWNLYGPTETAVWSSALRVEGTGETVPLGGPVANTRFYVLDDSLRPVPAGVPGELYIGGAGVARGYLGRPALTAERFVPDAHGAEPGARAYRTGDRVRWRRDGTLEFLGRADQQVKLRGFRIEPGEVEAALRALPGIREAAVVVREDAPGDRRLVAYLAGEGAAPAAVRAALAERLPAYMVPQVFVPLEALPRTPNGKLDRRALPAPGASARGGQYRAPRTEREIMLAAHWQAVLGVERVGIHDSFFDLGGHSLLMAELRARLVRETGTRLTMLEMLQHPTVAQLAARLDAGAAPAPEAAAQAEEERHDRARQGRERLRGRLEQRRAAAGAADA